MAEENRYFENGTLAYDVYAWQGTAVPQPQPHPQGLPEEHVRPQPYRRVKAKTAIAPFTLLGMIVVSCLMILVIFAYVQLFESTSQVSRLRSELSALKEQQMMLQSKYDGKIDLAAAQEYGEGIGLAKPLQEQIVFVNLSGIDRAEIYQQTRTSLLGEIVEAVRESVFGLIEYLHPSGA